MTKNVVFLSPTKKGGPYYAYKQSAKWLKDRHPNRNIRFFHSFKDRVKIHLGFHGKIDFLFSVLPFIFKPLMVNKYIFNPRGDRQSEKNNRALGGILSYFSFMNLKFSDNIWLTSRFLADKLSFGEQYKNKIIIIPNFFDLSNKNMEARFLGSKNSIKLLTVSSTKFLQKGLGIVDLGKQIAKIKDLNINWTIIAGGNNEYKKIIATEFYKIKFGSNIKVNWLDWIEKQKLESFYQHSDIFVYGTKLETWGQTIIEAMSRGLPVILYEYELWRYIYPTQIITNDIPTKLKEILDRYEYYSKVSLDFAKNFDKTKVLEKLEKFILE